VWRSTGAGLGVGVGGKSAHVSGSMSAHVAGSASALACKLKRLGEGSRLFCLEQAGSVNDSQVPTSYAVPHDLPLNPAALCPSHECCRQAAVKALSAFREKWAHKYKVYVPQVRCVPGVRARADVCVWGC